MDIRTVLGYEKISEERHVMDVFIEETEDGGYKIIPPNMPQDDMDLGETVFISLESYRKEETRGSGDGLEVKFVQVNNKEESIEYLAASLSGVRDDVLFRVVDIKTDNRVFGARLIIDDFIIDREQVNDVPDLFYNSEGRLEMEDPVYRNITKAHVEVEAFQCFNKELTEEETLEIAGKYKDLLLEEKLREKIRDEAKSYEIGIHLTRETLANELSD